MVRERTTNREFTTHYILPSEPESRSVALQSFLASSKKLEVDLGCGRGRFLLARAARFPETAFIGIERIPLRLQKVDTRATSNGLTNIRLIQAEALCAVQELLPPNAVTTFFLYFPDPWPKRRHHCRRLVSTTFISAVYLALIPGGCIHIATDHSEYFDAITKIWKKESRFQEIPPYIPPDEEETDFGMLFRKQGLSANRCSFRKSA